MKFSLRAAQNADLRAICAIDQASFSQPWQPQTFADALRDPKYIVLVAQSEIASGENATHENFAIENSQTATEFSESARREIAFAENVKNDGFVCGFGVAYTVGDEGEIATLAVDEAMRGAGAGEAILRALVEECERRGARQIFLEVRESNFKAQKIYARLSFAEVGKRKNYYADGETAIVMKKGGDEV